ncbi:MAG TPA: hypothetical protein VNP95_13160 [Thermomicrobiales bacterium]|nr:hypothetical protein [Thermomicrobiales bacterium]
MSDSTNQMVQIVGYIVIATILVVVGLMFMIRRRQYSFGMVCIITAVFIYGFGYYVSQADKIHIEEGSPEDNPEAYGTPAYRIVHP